MWPCALLVFGAMALVGAALLVAIFGSILADHEPHFPVTVIVAGSALQTTTSERTVADLLRALNIMLTEGDVLSVPPDSPVTPGMVIQIERARNVRLLVDGELRVMRTTLNSPQDILDSAGLTVSSEDLVFIDGTQTDAANLLIWPVPVNNIILRRAVSLQVNDDGATSTIQTTAGTIGEALFEAGVTLYLADVVSPAANTPVSDGLKVTITRSRPVTIIADTVSLETRTRGATVADALVDAGIALVGLDYTIPGEDTALLPGMSIRVIRVREELLTEETELLYKTSYQADATLEIDQRKVLQAGQKGIQQTTLRVRYENNAEISRVREETVTLAEPVNRVVAYGTSIVIRTVDTPEGPREYWRKFRMYATSYHPEALGGDDATATGRKLTKGVVSIDPDIIPYGTQVYVPNYGIGVAADTGGLRSTPYWIDLGYDDHNYVSWSRYVDVYLLTPIPDKINYLLPEQPR